MEKKEAVYYWENLRKTFSEYAEKEKNIWAKQHYQFSVEAIDAALDALKMPEKGEPLTIEQLREVPHGKIKDSTLQSICDRANEIARKPAHIDWKAWEPCESCISCENCKNSNVGEFCNPCFRCLQSDKKDGFSPVGFCRKCGRPLTDDAWDELEKRLRG